MTSKFNAVLDAFFGRADAGPVALVESGVDHRTRIARLEANPRRAEGLARARRRLADQFEQAQYAHGLATLRLKAGLSQQQAAQRLGMQQSNLSRLEKAPGDPQLSTLVNLARVYNVTLDEVVAAIPGAK